MKDIDVKYKPLLNGEYKLLNNEDEESGQSNQSPSSTRPSLPTNSSNVLQRFLCCPSKITFFLVIALFVALYLLTTLEVSFFSNRRSLKPTLQQAASYYQNSQSHLNNDNQKVLPKHQLLEPFSKLLNKLSFSVNKVNHDPTDQNLLSILPVRVQLNDTQTYQMIEQESNLAATYWQRWSSGNFIENKSKHQNVKYCNQVEMISPHQVKHNNLYWQFLEAPEVNIKSRFLPKKEEYMKLFLYNAYYDNRLWGKPAVKIVTATNKQSPVETHKWWYVKTDNYLL